MKKIKFLFMILFLFSCTEEKMISDLEIGVQLPQKLIISPDSYVEEMDALTGWSKNGTSTLELNNTDYKSGTGSLKLTNGAGTTYANMTKTVAWDLSSDGGASFRLWIYPQTTLTTTINNILIYLGTELAFTNYYRASITPTTYVVNEWNLMQNLTWTTTGTPNWANITVIKIQIGVASGQVGIASFDLAGFGATDKKAIMLSFDDGHESVYSKAYPLVKAKNMVATVYQQANVIGGGSYLTSANLITLNKNGWDIANHTNTHPHLVGMSKVNQEAEFNDCKLTLDGLGLSRASSHVAYPYGTYDDNTLVAMSSTSMKTGRLASLGGGISKAQPIYDGLTCWSYKILCLQVGNNDSLATIKGYLDTIRLKSRVVVNLLFHIIVDSNPDNSSRWLTQDFSDLLDYIELLGFQTLTIDEYYRLYSGGITVNCKSSICLIA